MHSIVIDGAGHPELSVYPGTLPWTRHRAGVKTNVLFSVRPIYGSVAFKRITVSDVTPAPSIVKCPHFTITIAKIVILTGDASSEHRLGPVL